MSGARSPGAGRLPATLHGPAGVPPVGSVIGLQLPERAAAAAGHLRAADRGRRRRRPTAPATCPPTGRSASRSATFPIPTRSGWTPCCCRAGSIPVSAASSSTSSPSRSSSQPRNQLQSNLTYVVTVMPTVRSLTGCTADSRPAQLRHRRWSRRPAGAGARGPGVERDPDRSSPLAAAATATAPRPTTAAASTRRRRACRCATATPTPRWSTPRRPSSRA